MVGLLDTTPKPVDRRVRSSPLTDTEVSLSTGCSNSTKKQEKQRPSAPDRTPGRMVILAVAAATEYGKNLRLLGGCRPDPKRNAYGGARGGHFPPSWRPLRRGQTVSVSPDRA